MVKLIRAARKGYLKQGFFDQFRHSQPNNGVGEVPETLLDGATNGKTVSFRRS